ncbi:MAG: hypothetical protein GY852_11875 [bacterium]|nr:hypothetical protein [bacterium]
MCILLFLFGTQFINPVLSSSESFSFTTPCTIAVEGCETFTIVSPVKAAYWNLHQGQGEHGLGVDTLSFTTVEYNAGTFLASGEGELLPPFGTFYITAEPEQISSDTITTPEPPHRTISNTVQISLRPDNSYTGYLYELINTPFIMAPRATPGGFNQADERLGTDCAGLAVYGRRRMGNSSLHYLGPRGILPYLEPVAEEEYYLTGSLFTSQAGDTARAPERGELLHFRSQVSIFLEDRGIPGILDVEDLVIQSWYNGTHICRIDSCGFADYPLNLYRWK